MKRIVVVTLLVLFFFGASPDLNAQCSICTRTAQQLGEKPAKGLNMGIIYLALTPFAIVGFIGYRFWKKNNTTEE